MHRPRWCEQRSRRHRRWNIADVVVTVEVHPEQDAAPADRPDRPDREPARMPLWEVLQ